MLKNWVFEHGARRDIGTFGLNPCLLCLTRRWRFHRTGATGPLLEDRGEVHRRPANAGAPEGRAVLGDLGPAEPHPHSASSLSP